MDSGAKYRQKHQNTKVHKFNALARIDRSVSRSTTVITYLFNLFGTLTFFFPIMFISLGIIFRNEIVPIPPATTTTMITTQTTDEAAAQINQIYYYDYCFGLLLRFFSFFFIARYMFTWRTFFLKRKTP